MTSRKVQENSYKYDKETERFSTQEERTVHNTWNHDIFQGRNKSHQQQASCPIKHSTFECREINAFKDSTILSVFPSANGSITTATPTPEDWDLLSYFNSVNSAVAWNAAKEDEIDFDDVSSEVSAMDTSQASSTVHDRPPPAEIDVPKMSPPQLPPMQEEQSDAIHHLPEELNPHHAEAPNVPASEPSPSNEDHATASQNDAGHSTTNISSEESSDNDTLGSSLAPNHSNNPKPQDNPGPEEIEQDDDDEFDDDDDNEEMPSSPLDEDELNRPPEDMEHEEDVPNNLPPPLPPAKEDKSKTLKLFSLETCQRNPSALTPVDTNSVEPILAGLNKWYDYPGRNQDKEED